LHVGGGRVGGTSSDHPWLWVMSGWYQWWPPQLCRQRWLWWHVLTVARCSIPEAVVVTRATSDLMAGLVRGSPGLFSSGQPLPAAQASQPFPMCVTLLSLPTIVLPTIGLPTIASHCAPRFLAAHNPAAQVTPTEAGITAGAAFIANTFESYVGAGLQGRVPWLSNDLVNVLQISVATALAVTARHLLLA